MPARLSDEDRSEILRLYFLAGEQRDSIASKLDISEGTVWNVVTEFKRAFGVPKDLDIIHKLAVILRELELTPADAKAGADLLEGLKGLDADGEGLSRFVSGLYKAAEGRGHEIAEIVDGSIRLLNLEAKTEKGYEELLKSFEELSAKSIHLAEEVGMLRAEAKTAKEEKVKAIEDRDATLEALTEFCAARKVLQDVNVNVGDYVSLGNMITNAKELDMDPKRITEEIAAVDGLVARRTKLEESVAGLEKRVNAAEGKLGKLTTAINEKQPLLEKVQEVEAFGLRIEDLETLKGTIARVGSRHGLSPAQSMGKLIKDLREQYDEELGFENQLDAIKAQIEAAKLNCDTWGARLENLKSSHKAEKSVIDAMRALMAKGVDGQKVVEWNTFLEKLGTDIERFGKDLDGYAQVLELIAAKEKEVKGLEGDAAALRAQIEALKGEKSKIVNSIKALRLEGIAEIKKVESGAMETLRAQTEGFKGQLSTTESVLKDLSQTAINELNKTTSAVINSVRDAGNEMAEEASKHLKEAEEVTDVMKTSIDSAYERALEVGKKLGEFKSLEPLLQLIASHEGDKPAVYSTMQQLCQAFKDWLANNPPNDARLTTWIDWFIIGFTKEIFPA